MHEVKLIKIDDMIFMQGFAKIDKHLVLLVNVAFLRNPIFRKINSYKHYFIAHIKS